MLLHYVDYVPATCSYIRSTKMTTLDGKYTDKYADDTDDDSDDGSGGGGGDGDDDDGDDGDDVDDDSRDNKNDVV